MTVLIPAYEPTEKMIRLIAELKEKTDYPILIVLTTAAEHPIRRFFSAPRVTAARYCATMAIKEKAPP
jgi:hypothetical protein